MPEVDSRRAALTQTLFPAGVPTLWCPLLTHYREDGSIDVERMRAHLAHLRPHVPAFLAPGSTGDGWEMADDEVDQLLAFLIEEAERQEFSIMVGVLRTGSGEARGAIERYLQRFTAGATDEQTFAARRLAGFTVTAPKGAHLDQQTIHAELDAIAALGAPLAIYQLPQITENEMAPDTVSRLAAARANVYLLKDTSGADRVIGSDADLHGLFMVRGAEGDYARWFKRTPAERLYDGFLLSTANCFAAELSGVIRLLGEDRVAEAQELSTRVARVVTAVFAAAAPLPFGNPFANANKAIDHFFAHGATLAHKLEPPMTHSGTRLPRGLVSLAGEALVDEGFSVEHGYL